MHALSIDDSTPDRTRQARRIDVTDAETTWVIEDAATRENLHFERRGGWTYLIER